jgi:hypothetical protein
MGIRVLAGEEVGELPYRGSPARGYGGELGYDFAARLLHPPLDGLEGEVKRDRGESSSQSMRPDRSSSTASVTAAGASCGRLWPASGIVWYR